MSRARRKKLFLIGYADDDIRGSKLPSRRDCLKVLHHLMNSVEPKMTLRKSANQVVEKCLRFWERAHIPTTDRSDCVRKLLDLYREWKKLDENQSLNTDTQRRLTNKFEFNLDNLFDIAHEKASEIIELEEDRNFLIQQRKPGRQGAMLGVVRNSTSVRKARVQTTQPPREIRRPWEDKNADSSVPGCSNQHVPDSVPEVIEIHGNSTSTPRATSSAFTLPIIKNVTSVAHMASSDEDVQFIQDGVSNADDEIFISDCSINDVTSTSEIGGNDPPNTAHESKTPFKAEETNPADHYTDEDLTERYWAEELKKIKRPDQVIWAKKFISDILVEGQLGNLHREAVRLRVLGSSQM